MAVVDQSGKDWSYWTDSMEEISQCSKQHLSTKDMTALEADIVLAIRHTLKSHGVKGNYNFVQGNQDDNKKFSALDIEEKYNVLCNK